MALLPGSFEQRIRFSWWSLLILAVGLAVLIRAHLAAIPLERDEGEYAYAGQLLLGGVPPYRFAYSMKFPGVYAAYALIMAIFGQTAIGVHLGLLIVNVLTVIAVFFVAKRLLSPTGATAAAASYAVLSLSSSVLGLAAHATHFAMLAVMAGSFLLLNPTLTKKSIFISGVLFGIGFLMKQPAIVFICFGAIYFLFRDRQGGVQLPKIILRLAIFTVAAALPLVAASLCLWQAGVFQKFWLWAVLYAREYGSLTPFSGVFPAFLLPFTRIVVAEWPLMILALLGVVAMLFDKNIQGAAFFILSFLVISAVATSAGFYFRRHYFIFDLPAVSLLVGASVMWGENVCSRFAPPCRVLLLIIFGASLSAGLVAERHILLARDSSEATRAIYGANPFPEAVRIADYLRQNSSSTDTIAVVGSEPEIYFYAHRRSATGYIYTYELMEPQKFAADMQREMIREVEAARPKYLVFVVASVSWLETATSDRQIFAWVKDYAAANLTLVGLVNILSPERTDYYLPIATDPRSIQLSQNYLLIFGRKPE